MVTDVRQADGLRRSLAVFVDFLVFFAIWFAVGVFLPTGSLVYALALFLLIDVLLTAFIGLSPGRFATRIRVVRDADGAPPGLWPALLRTSIVVLTGWIGMFVYLLQRRYVGGSAPRMWWDAAARTRLAAIPPAVKGTPT